MLRVGLTGSLSSGKSTVARMLARHGAHVLFADEIARELMQPGQPVFHAIVGHFGPQVLAADGTLNRATLARIAFADGRSEELNAIVHPPVIARQSQLAAEIAAQDPYAIVVIESALIFETTHAGSNGWHTRFDCILLTRAAEDLILARFLKRSLGDATPTPRQLEELTAEARRRLARQLPDDEKARRADYILVNNGSLDDLQQQVDQLWPKLEEAARQKR